MDIDIGLAATPAEFAHTVKRDYSLGALLTDDR
jgi:hypothetical protein